MNSADKSIALIDVALRRRFTFIEYNSDPSYLSENVEDINLKQLLQCINSRVEFLLDRDHLIGHAYLIDVNSKSRLCEVFRNKLIPLLKEYFYNDLEKIRLVLGDHKKLEAATLFISDFSRSGNRSKGYFRKRVRRI
jgi:5-methylcytosine-specific restriction protein B